jgi:hypothetical protein
MKHSPIFGISTTVNNMLSHIFIRHYNHQTMHLALQLVTHGITINQYTDTFFAKRNPQLKLLSETVDLLKKILNEGNLIPRLLTSD